METKETEKVSHKKIDNACKKFKDITDNIQNQKFEHLDSWLDRKARIFKSENKNVDITIFPRFDYGTILKVDFGINEGSELSGPHFAISLSRYDSVKNPVLTVLPLTSQKKEYNLPLNELIVDEFTKRLSKHITRLKNEIEELTNSQCVMDDIIKKGDELKLLDSMVEYYSNYAKNSYACINQITTISKKKIVKPKNQFDIIGRAKCNFKTMEFISKEIAKKYTNLHIDHE